VGPQRLDFAEFYRNSADECLRTVLISVSDQDTARELVDEAIARAWASWRTARSAFSGAGRAGCGRDLALTWDSGKRARQDSNLRPTA